ncbi:hypothetical protein JCM17960_08050 [Magnetospira thiophila]
MSFALLSDSPIKSGYAYHLLRCALEKFGVGPGQLDDSQGQVAAAQAERAFRLESKALSTPEALAVGVDTDRLAASLAEIAARYESRGAFLRDLQSNGLDEGALREGLARELRFGAVMERIGAQAESPSAAEVQQFFDANGDKFQQLERRRVRHILITINDDYTENAPQQAAQRATELVARLRDKPASFAALAQAVSECPSALEGGALGMVGRGQLYPEVDEQLFKMAEGDIAGPVKSDMGYHILLCEAILPARAATLDEAAPRIREYLLRRRQQEVQRQWLHQIGALGDRS